jgi:hypothetical protein
MDFHIGLTPGRLYNLVCAVAGEEITVREFRCALKPLSPESIQWVGTVLALQSSLGDHASEWLLIPKAICRASAAAKRSLN